MFAAAFSRLATGVAQAGAWPMAPGRTQVITKYERFDARQGYGPDDLLVDIDPRRDETLSAFVEHGLTARLTLQAKVGLTRGRDRWVNYSGRGPVELGLRWTPYRDDRSALAIYLGAGEAGAGRNAGYAAPGQGSLDLEARALYGRSALWKGREVFVELEAARLKRQGLADETRIDATFGVRPAKKWLILAQSYTGRADRLPVGSRWTKTELSIVRAFGDWSLQAGWRDTPRGRETTRDRGVVLAMWRKL